MQYVVPGGGGPVSDLKVYVSTGNGLHPLTNKDSNDNINKKVGNHADYLETFVRRINFYNMQVSNLPAYFIYCK